jgi:hypothetical protein
MSDTGYYFKAVRRKIAKKAKKLKIGNYEDFDIIVKLKGLVAYPMV